MNKKTKKRQPPARPVERKLLAYESLRQNPLNRLIHYFFVPIFTFALLGLIWAIPLQFSFLGKYKDFFNIASVVIGVVMYLYLKLSPTLSYAMLLTVALFSFCIVQLEYWERAGGPAFWLVCLILLFLSWIALQVGSAREERKVSLAAPFKAALIAPLWLWSKLFKKLKIPF